MAKTKLLGLLLLVCGSSACAYAADAPVVAPDPVTDNDDDDDLFAAPGCRSGIDFEAACLSDDIAECCPVAGIKYEYEMLEGANNGDQATAQSNRDRLLELLSHGCDLGSELSCGELEVQTSPRPNEG